MIGQHILNYEITERLGEGGMGVVYKATDVLLGREVALKMLHTPLINQSQFLERFKKEARILAQLLHPNIAVIYNFVEQDSNHYMVMEYVHGKTLDGLLHQQKILSCEAIIPVFIQTLEGLQHAHKKGIFHRDIKPSNIILAEDGTIKLMDFGIAKMAGEQRITQVNRVVGTVEYMAPELIQGKDPSAASDLYAVGVTMYELLTGKLPFENSTDFNLMQEILKKKPLSPEKLNSAIPKSLANIINKSLEKKPENRFKNAKEFQQALIMAFPELADLNINDVLRPPVAEMKATQIISAGGINTGTGNMQATRIETYTKPVTLLQNIKTKILSKEKRPIVLAAIGTALIAIVLLAVFTGKSKNTLADIPGIQNTNDPANQNDPGNNTTDDQNGYGNNNVSPVNPNENEQGRIIIPTNTTPSESEEKKKETKEKKTRDTETSKEPDTNKKEETKSPPDNTKTDPPKEPEKKEETTPAKSKVIFIEDRLEVPLYLQNSIDPSTAREGQSLKFSVTRSISYKGETIINKGVAANGKITKVSKRKIAVVIDNVQAASGQYIPLQDIELSGRIEEISSNRNYTAKLKKGGIIKF